MRWVTFDCYGTLVDWQTAFTSVLSRVAGGRAADVVRAYHAAEPDVTPERPHRPFKEVLASALVRAADQVGVALSRSDAAGLQHSWQLMRPFDDVEELLAGLRARGYRLGVLTNCDDELFALTHRAFRRPFDLFVTAERVRGYKPARWHFRAFELITRTRRSDWVHVSASWYHDIVPARTLGVKRVWLDRERTGNDPAMASAHVYSASDAVHAIDGLFESSVQGVH
jgi:2-haloacid dehalogenase